MATLGELLNQKNADKFPEGVTKDSKAASSAYAPGYSKQSISDTASPNARSVGEGLTSHADVPLAGSSDLHLDALRALSSFTWSKLDESNTYRPPELQSDATGHAKSDVLTYTTRGFAPQVEYTDEETGEKRLELPPELKTSQGTYQVGSYGETLPNIVDGVHTHHVGVGSSLMRTVLPHGGNSDNNDLSSFGGPKLPSQTAKPDPGNIIPEAAFELLKEANRYSPSDSTPYILPSESGQRGEKRFGKGLYSLQGGSFGKFAKDRQGVTILELRRAAIELLHRAQSFSATEAEDQGRQQYNKNSPFTGTAELNVLIPQLTQVGAGTMGVRDLKIRSMRIMQSFDLSEGANDIIEVESFKTAMGVGGDDDQFTKQIPRNATSYGTMNSPAEPFNGVAPFGMIVPVIYAIFILALFGLAIGALISAIGTKSAKPRNAEDPSSLQFGANVVGQSKTVGEKFLDIYNLPREGGLELFSMVKGIMLFFGININPIMPGSSPGMDAVINLLMGPGYYLVVSKKILADFTQVTEAFSNFTNITGLFSGITIFLSSIEALMSSFTVRWFIIMNNIGLIVEKSISRQGEAGHSGGTPVIPLSEQESVLALSPAIRNSISRWHGGVGKPKSPLSAHLFSTLLASPVDAKGPSGLQMPKTADQQEQNVLTTKLNSLALPPEGRFTSEQVARFEEAIDAEYMPFSIHDLRTNEVISLPAFIDSVSDDFSADYSSTHGFGRTDPVHSYARTERSINLNFTLVAMNPEDHDYIWYLVNKFVTMVYPQRDRGMLRKTESGQVFAQPFSQRVVASPVIRIRLGDVMQSNATHSAMKKIFGGQSVLSLQKSDTPEDVKQGEKENASFAAARSVIEGAAKVFTSQALFSGGGEGFEPLDGTYTVTKGTTLYAVVEEKYFEFVLQYDREAKIGKYVTHPKESKRKKKIDEDASVSASLPVGYWEMDLQVEDDLAAFVLGGGPLLTAYRNANEGIPIPPPPFGPAPKVTVIMPNTSTVNGIKFEPSNDLVVEEVAKGKESEVFKQSAGSNDASQQTIMETGKSAPAPDQSVTDTIEAFMDPENNSFVRAFETAKGRGLAGVIKQLGLQYDTSIAPWGTTFEEGAQITGRRAPKMVKISMAFAPIHDFPLGLNHNGEIFAPSHPAGLLSPAREELFSKKLTDMEVKFNSAKLAVIGELPDTSDPGKPKLPF